MLPVILPIPKCVHHKVKLFTVFQLYLYLAALFFLVTFLPNNLWSTETKTLIIALGIIGLWRWGWWSVHVIRSLIYRYIRFPRMRKDADKLWTSGWRPEEVIYMMTTYKEEKEITFRVIQSIVDSTRDVGVHARLYIGTGDLYDEEVVNEFFEHELEGGVDLEVIYVRQLGKGKRGAISTVLKAMSRNGIPPNAPVIFMDGDAILEKDCVVKCVPFFETMPIAALTTNEQAIVWGPNWIQTWLDLRFGQRHLGMMSHALSKKVLTLTGRMSVFRGQEVIKPDFINIIESDSLNNWLWGKFGFLSGDDKSTWFDLLRGGAEMTYVPDAMSTTIEVIEGNGIDRMQSNLIRWSGNMLRNGSRAISLGPKRIGFFIWWCLIDQRLSIWTVLIGPIITILSMIFVSSSALLVYIIWLLFTRLIASVVIGLYAQKFSIGFPFVLYFSQILNAIIKAYIWFRLPKQAWTNRGNKGVTVEKTGIMIFRNHMAIYLTALAVLTLIYALGLFTNYFNFYGFERAANLFF